jgi:hypothetical protein
MNQQNTNDSAHQLVRNDLDTAVTSVGLVESVLGTSDVEHGEIHLTLIVVFPVTVLFSCC